MKFEDLKVGMEVKLRKNLGKCTFKDLWGDKEQDCDLYQYSGGDTVEVNELECNPDFSSVWVKKMGATTIKVDAKHLRKIK